MTVRGDVREIKLGLDNFSTAAALLTLYYARKKQVFQAFTPFGS